MDSSSPSTSGCDSSGRSDARNGEGLAVDEIIMMKEKRLRLLDNYRNEQEESILPLMREADDINRKRKKKSKSQFHAENNIPLRRSERIMTQTLNENRALESPVNQPQLESDPISEPQHEPEFEPEPAPRELSEPEPVPMDESEPEPVPTDESESEVDGSEPEPVPMDESESEVDESEPELAPMDESESEVDESEPEPVPMDESESEADESEPEAVTTDESESESTYTDDSESELEPQDGVEQNPPRGRRVIQRLVLPRGLFQMWRGVRLFLDVQLAYRRVFAVIPLPRNVVDPIPVPRWGQVESKPSDNWYGEKRGFAIGYRWNTRLECSHDKVHRPSIAGIHPGPQGAYSVALSGVYPEDVDRGNVVIFTGAGGRDLRSANGRSRNVRSAPQVRDQELNKANWSLIRSMNTGLPVRLIRGYKLASFYAPERGYRYDGLYRVVRFWYGRGFSGYHVFRFKMFRLTNQKPPPWETERRGLIPRGIPLGIPARRVRDALIRELRQLNQNIDERINRLAQNLRNVDDEEDGRDPPGFRGGNAP